jgi:DNA-binding XRE family transcriptional regulator
VIGLQRIEVAGRRFVLVEEAEYERLCAKASETVPLDDESLPPLPKPDRHGRFPALAYARASLARDVIRDRRAAGLTQQELADLAGTRQETISRIERGNYTASHKLVERIDRAFKSAKKAKTGASKRR